MEGANWRKIVGRLGRLLFTAKILVGVAVVVFASSVSVATTNYQAEIGSSLNVTNVLIATDRGFSYSSSPGSAAGTSCSTPVVFSSLPRVANTTISVGHWIYDVRLNATTSVPTTPAEFNVTLYLASGIYGPLCIETNARPVDNTQIIDCRFDVGTMLPSSPYTFKVTVQ